MRTAVQQLDRDRVARAPALPTKQSISLKNPVRAPDRQNAGLESPSSIGLGSAAAPDIMRTVAMAVSRTPLQNRWLQVADAPIPALPELVQIVSDLKRQTRSQKLETVNRWVNRRIQFASDQEVYGEADHWATLAEAMAHGRGDCEDYAIAKMQLLRAAGVPSSDLYLVIARDLVRRADHALLMVRLDGDFMVLDSSNDLVMAESEVQDYQPVMTFSGNQSWLHGYSRPSVTMVASR